MAPWLLSSLGNYEKSCCKYPYLNMQIFVWTSVSSPLGKSKEHDCWIVWYMSYDVECLFICLFAIFVSSLGEMSVKVFDSFFNQVVCFLTVEL